MPDRWGVGTGTGSFTGRALGQEHGGSAYQESFGGDETLTSTWLEWDIPNATSDPVSFSGMRDNFIRDYRGAPPSDGLLSVSKTIDESGGRLGLSAQARR